MAVTECNLLYYEQQNASFKEANYTAHYQVITDDPADGPITITSSGLLPAPYSQLALGNDSANAYVTGYGAITLQSFQHSRRVWTADVIYSSNIPEGEKPDSGGELAAHPADYPWEFSEGGERSTRAVSADTAGNKIKNSANDPLDDAEADRSGIRMVFGKSKYAGTFVPEDEMASLDKVNDALWWNKPAGEWKCEEVSHELVRHPGGDYYKCQYVFVSRAGGWQLSLVDRGTRDIDGNLPSDTHGVLFGGIAPLDGAGNFKAIGDDLTLLDFDVYDTTNFSVNFGVPTDYSTL